MAGNTNLNFSDFDGLFDDMFAAQQSSVEQSLEAEKNVTAKPEKQASTINIQQVNAPVNINVLQSAQAKLSQIGIEMNQLFVERDELVNIMLLAVITGTNLLMLGPPGTGKSHITYELCNRIENANYFQWMLNKTSDPSEILGPFSVKEMENDKFMRVTAGKLPEAHIAFIDECYKSNAPTLNALLTIMNEHIFYNDGKPTDVPLISMFGASNEPPEDESLMALHDRFLFRINLSYIKDAANKKRMHNNYIDKRAGVLGLAGKTTITLEEIKALQKEAQTVSVPKDMINKFIRLINDLDKQAIHISDRRSNECLKIMQGSAVAHGRKSVTLDDFKALTYVLWEKEDQIAIIESVIGKLVNPYDEQFGQIKTQFEQIKGDIDRASASDKAKKALESKNSIEKIVQKANKLINEAAKNAKDITEFTEYRDMMITYNQDLVAAALGTTFNF